MKKASKEPKIAYVIPGPTEHLTLEVKHSANAWWMDAPKLHRLLRAFEAMSPIAEACDYAGITVKQYKYFAQEHPIVKELRMYPEVAMSLIARQSLARGLQHDWKLAFKYLSRKDRLREQKLVKKDKELSIKPNPAIFYEMVDGELREI
jgi:hypothetical protein